jgi:hypothetical protein
MHCGCCSLKISVRVLLTYLCSPAAASLLSRKSETWISTHYVAPARVEWSPKTTWPCAAVHTPGPANPLFTGPNIILIHRRSQIISMIVTCLYNGVFTSRNFRHFFIKKVRITVHVCLHT